MKIGALPIAGIPLPLISYGGSAMITTLGALGLVESVVVRRRTVIHHPPARPGVRPHEPLSVRPAR
jgi:cell division protein FtsW (lipid II flippase)